MSDIFDSSEDVFADLIAAQAELERSLEIETTKETPIYLTGTSTPTLGGSGTAGTFTYTANANVIEWTRIGNRLFYNGRISISATAVAPTGNMSVRGWPYTFVSDATMAIAGVGVLEWAFIDMPAGWTSISLQHNNGTTTAFLVRSGDNVNQATVQGAELVGGVYDLRFGGNYRVA